MKNKAIIILACVLIVGMGLAIYAWRVERTKNQQIEEAITLTSPFYQHYGQNANLVRRATVKNFYIFYRTTSDNQTYASMFVDGLWIELGPVTQR